MQFIVGCVVVVILLALIIFPDFRRGIKVLIGGFLGIFVKNMANTPDGARAVYDQAIAEAEENYKKVSKVLNKFSGELKEKKDQIAMLERNIKRYETECEALVQAGRYDDARVFSDKRNAAIAELEGLKEYRDQLEPMVAEATQAHTMYAKKLQQLKDESTRVVNEMQLNRTMDGLLADLDELRRDSATDKLLGAVRDGASDLRKEVQGGMVVHQNRLSTKVAQAEAAARSAQSDAYLNELMEKYKKK